jgi:trans-2,3-dihydro-3-hydroxyanthranilate isomerase
VADFEYFTVDVFTRSRFGGNPLAVFPNAAGLDTATMQALAAEMNYSETSFVLPPQDAGNTANVRIFNRTAEMPFAGHPNVGTAYVLARHGFATGEVLRFEETSGLVETRLLRDGERCVGAEIDAPQPLALLDAFEASDIAACLSLDPSTVRIEAHPPIRATVGVDFVFVEVAPDALGEAAPDLAAYRRVAASRSEPGERLSIFAYAASGDGVRARMFAPLSGTWEDPATGSANATLAALRLSLSDAPGLAYEAVQGVEMGRESNLSVRAWRARDGIRAAVGGHCVDMFRGTVSL